MQELLQLPIQIQATLVPGYLGYALLKRDYRKTEKITDMSYAEAFNSPESYLSKFFGDEKFEEEKIENIEEWIQNLTVFIETVESVLEEYKTKLASLADGLQDKPQ
ncbi:hypothetical protein [Psychrobacter frigidicola]|uniref:hypothetical protein n=1 Tax=Psychrobacter frigidicola TaxID=45611 RepID=UPI00191A54FA|nr:hypothetical protein [Psychrobacter frigidicola]